MALTQAELDRLTGGASVNEKKDIGCTVTYYKVGS